MGKKDLTYWDEELSSDIPILKKKNKDRDADEYPEIFDSEECEHLPLSSTYLNRMADILEQFLQLADRYFIYPDLSVEEYRAARKRIKKAISRMRKGDTRDFDYDRTMEAIVNGDIPEKYIDGGV